MGKSVHDHRREAGIARVNKVTKKIIRHHGNEEFIFDTRRTSCRVEFDIAVAGKNRENQIFATFLDIQGTRILKSFNGEDEYEQTPIIRLSLRQIKERIKEYNYYNAITQEPEDIRDTSALIAARDACKKQYPTHHSCPN